MVESRWLRWIGPGVVALGAVGFIASTTLGAGGPPVGAERLRRVRRRTGSLPHATASRGRRRPARQRPGSGWTRSSTAMGRSLANA